MKHKHNLLKKVFTLILSEDNERILITYLVSTTPKFMDFQLRQKSKAKTYKKQALIYLNSSFLFSLLRVPQKNYKLLVCRKPKNFENHCLRLRVIKLFSKRMV